MTARYTLTLNWSSNIYYQGDSGSVIISLQSTCGNELEFTWVGIHSAWMQSDYFYRFDLSANPIRIASDGSCTFNSIGFSVDSDANTGWNEYYVRISYNEHHWYGWLGGTWTSDTNLLNIHNTWEKTYHELQPQTSSKINGAQNADYESPDAESYLQQAQTSYNLAASLATQGKWQEATSNLQDASNLVDQAIAAETNYWKQKATEAIDTAASKIEQIRNVENSNAREFLQQAQDKLNLAQSSCDQGTLAGYKSACSKVEEAISYVDQARSAEQTHQQQKQQMSLIAVGAVIGGLALIFTFVAVIVIRRKREAGNPKALS